MLPYKDQEGDGSNRKKGCGYNEVSIKWEEFRKLVSGSPLLAWLYGVESWLHFWFVKYLFETSRRARGCKML